MWWLINNDNVEEIKCALEYAIEKTDDRCASTGCMCDTGAKCLCSRIYRDALHSLESGLHKTTEIPEDFYDEPL